MSTDAGQEAFDAAMSGTDGPVVETGAPAATETPASPGTAPAGPSGGEAPQTPSQQAPDGFVPSWRLREISEERSRLAREATELRQWREQRETEDRKRQEEEAAKAAGFDWENPQGFVDGRLQAGVKQAIDPVQQQMAQMREFQSRQFAIMQHGPEKVQAAFEAARQAISAGDPDAVAAYQQAMRPDNLHPFGDLMAWHQRRSVLSEVGTDTAAYRQKIIDEALKDPAFQQRAIEAARAQATPVITGTSRPSSPSIPSLNRTTSAADPGLESDDPQDTFNSAMNSPKRRRTG